MPQVSAATLALTVRSGLAGRTGGMKVLAAQPAMATPTTIATM